MYLRIALAIAAYLLGAIPFGFLLVKYVFTEGEDVRSIGSGATGATNVARRAGRLAGVLTYALDVAKGVAAVTLMRLVAPDDYFWLGAAAIAAIAGHIFPIFLGFRGGKGAATGFGIYLALGPYSVLTALVVWALVVSVTRYISLGSIVATASVPLWTLLYYGLIMRHQHWQALVVIGVVGSTMIVAKHHENIGRLLRGVESKVGTRGRSIEPEHKTLSGSGS